MNAIFLGQLGCRQFLTDGFKGNLGLEAIRIAFPLRYLGGSFVSRYSLATGPKSCDHLSFDTEVKLKKILEASVQWGQVQV